MKTKPYTKNKKKTNGDEWTTTGSVSSKRTNEKPQCHRCKTCKDGCEFYDGGFCRGVCYASYPPQFRKCAFDVNGNETKQYFTDEEIDKILRRKSFSTEKTK